ncbi:MAG: hypothetical protein NUW37_03280, partial [Planctomycetes bacterium]|nr:hypothetical protein [Planctomycetota bacterium]
NLDSKLDYANSNVLSTASIRLSFFFPSRLLRERIEGALGGPEVIPSPEKLDGNLTTPGGSKSLLATAAPTFVKRHPDLPVFARSRTSNPCFFLLQQYLLKLIAERICLRIFFRARMMGRAGHFRFVVTT